MARILVVDDVRFISKILASFFKDRGHVVDVADDGEQALEFARRDLPELILTDISMPRMDGLEVVRRLKSQVETAFIPIIVVTARNDANALTEAKEAGVDEYVLKPFDAPRLIRKAAALLGGFPMNYSLALHSGVPVVTALPTELTIEAVTQLRDAVAAAGRVARGPMVLDLTRVAKLEVNAAAQVLAVLTGFRLEGGELHMVSPTQGVGVRAFTGRLEGQAEFHDGLASALTSLGADPGEAGKPVRLGAPAPRTKLPVA